MSRKVPASQIENGKLYDLVSIDDDGNEQRVTVKADVIIERRLTFTPTEYGAVKAGPMTINQWIEER